jgi:cellobiose epimerase
MTVADPAETWAQRLRAELTDNILKFWHDRALDRAHGGFFGLIDANGRVDPDAPRASVVNTRILWTFAAATRLLGGEYRETADWALDYVLGKLWDHEAGGLFWMLDADGNPVSARKQTYGQAFGLYALAEYARATGGARLETAQQLFHLIEAHAHDDADKGYLEALDRGWQPLADMRLSDKDMNCPKSMNTHLHVMEAYTNLLRLWRDPQLEARQGELIELMLTRILDPQTGHLRLFFAQDWASLSPTVSYGHDIEASWLMVEAADVLGDSALLARAREASLRLASAVLAQGVDADGSILYETDGIRLDAQKHWWVQAEAMVGFFNAWQLSGDDRFRRASRRVWDYIDAKVVNRVQGEWHARLSRLGVPLMGEPETDIVGPWKCPYHNARACLEMLARLH